MSEGYANNFATALTAAIDADDVTITVRAAAPAALSGTDFRIVIGDELLIVTAGEGTTTWTVTRGAEGTTAAAHAAQSVVAHVLTAAGLRNAASFNVLAYGAKGDGVTDDTAAIQAAIDAAVLAGGTVYLPGTNGLGYRVTATLYIQPSAGRSQAACNITSDDGPKDPALVNGIVWDGADSASVFVARGWKVSTITGLNVRIPAGSDGVVAWDITDPTGAASTGHLTFAMCSVQLAGTNGTAWRGGALDSTGADVSFLTFVNCTVSGSAAGDGHTGWSINHANCLNWTWHDGFGWNLDVMVDAIGSTGGGGSMFFYGLGSSHNLLDFRPGRGGPWTLVGGRFEVGERFLECGVYDGGNSYPMQISVIGVEIASYTPADGILFMLGTPAQVLIENAGIDGTGWTAAMFTLGGAATGYGSLTIRGGSIQSASDPFHTVGHGHWTVRVENVGSVDGTGAVVAQMTPRNPDELAALRTYWALNRSLKGIIGYWRFNEASGTVAADEIGNVAGTYTNTPTLGATGLLTGDANKAMTLASASSQYVTLGDPAIYRFVGAGEPFSVAAVVKLTDNGAEQFVVSRHNTPSSGWRVSVQAAGAVVFERGGVYTQTANGAYVFGTTGYIVATYDGANIRVYLNAAPSVAVAATAALTDPNCSTDIGRWSGQAWLYVDGTVDEVAIFNRALTQSEITALYRVGTGVA